MNAPVWMALYPADYLAATRHLSAAQHGAYLLLIMSYWQNGGLPDDDRTLARLAAMTDREWKANREVIAAFFQPGWGHTRIDRELARANEKSGRRAVAGKKGGDAKAAKQPSKPVAIATNLPQQTPSKTVANDLAPSRDNSQLTSQKEKNPNQPQQEPQRPQEAAAAWEAGLEQKCREAAGLETDPSPGLLVIGPIWDMVQAGWSLEAHILPRLRAVNAAGRKGRSWSFYAKIIAEEATSPPKAQPPPVNGVAQIAETKDQLLARIAAKHGLNADGQPISN